MSTEPQLAVEERLFQLLQHLGIAQAHFAASIPGDVTSFAIAHAPRLASLTLICPFYLDPSLLGSCASRLLIVTGDQGPPAALVQHAVTQLPEATLVALPDYFSPPWADVIADRTDAIGGALLDFLASSDRRHSTTRVTLPEGADEVAGIPYRVQGMGPPLVLFPLGLAPSQWAPLLSRLSAQYCTISLGGPALGFVALLESRGYTAGYWGMVRQLLETAQLQPGEGVLDVGCGSGVLDRWLAQYTGGANRIVGVDINRYLLGEAATLVRHEGLEGVIEFREGSAEALPFPEASFAVTMSHTVLEEGDADRMLAELVRVTKPGGRVAVIVRAIDIPRVVNVPLRSEVKTKAEIPRGFVGALGCADASLYRRFHQTGVTQVQMLPQFAAFEQPHTPQGQFLHDSILGALTAEETKEWHAGIARALADGTYFIAQAFHCAVGTKPNLLG
jgi:ubiquinone/menaquinone biosynthesis C-methylase UbiE